MHRSPRLLHRPGSQSALRLQLKYESVQAGFCRRGTYYNRQDGAELRKFMRSPVLGASEKVAYYVAIQPNPDTAGDLSSEFVRSAAAAPVSDEQARRLNDQLADIARLNTLGDLAGRLAHELNQPLTAISNYAQGCANRLRARQIQETELAAVLDLIRDAALRAGEIVDRLRNFVRRKGPHQVEIDLASLIRRVLDLIEPEIRQSRVQVEVETPDGLPSALADEPQIEQVIVSLIRNGLEAMVDTPVDQRRLLIRSRSATENEIEVDVCDAGRGLHGEAAERLFEPFFSTKPCGLGMGLPISRSILQWHGGRNWAEPNLDRGVCFCFTLPVKHGETSNGDGE